MVRAQKVKRDSDDSYTISETSTAMTILCCKIGERAAISRQPAPSSVSSYSEETNPNENSTLSSIEVSNQSAILGSRGGTRSLLSSQNTDDRAPDSDDHSSMRTHHPGADPEAKKKDNEQNKPEKNAEQQESKYFEFEDDDTFWVPDPFENKPQGVTDYQFAVRINGLPSLIDPERTMYCEVLQTLTENDPITNKPLVVLFHSKTQFFIVCL